MDEFISIDKLIRQAKSKGINFGSGDPYNRLRYYTKIGWLPHMVRKSDKSGNIKGHYPTWCVDRLVLIENLKIDGLTNDEISQKLKAKNKFQDFLNVVKSQEVRKQGILYLILILITVTFMNELGITNIGKSKNTLIAEDSKTLQIIQSGTSFVPKNQRKIFVSAINIRTNSKVYITFTQDYSPATRYWVADLKDQDGFLLELDAPVFDNTEFSWWLSQ